MWMDDGHGTGTNDWSHSEKKFRTDSEVFAMVHGPYIHSPDIHDSILQKSPIS
jgi:hypothetical protein